MQLDISNSSVNNFHIVFLWELCSFLGIKPENNYSETQKIFDLRAGKFALGIPGHHNYLNEKQSLILHQILCATSDNSHELKLSINERRFFVNNVLSFYNLHLERPGELKSLKVLSEIFS